MIFGIALANITHKLDSLRQKGSESISSHEKLKQEGLACLKALIEEAPTIEYVRFFKAKDHAILIAYALNLLCHYSRSDKSRSIRISSLRIMISLMDRVEDLHHMAEMDTNCSISPLVSALPGISSTMFQLVMSDTKLPRGLFVLAIKNLSKLITITFLPCEHKIFQTKLPQQEKQKVKDICDNFAIRLDFLVNYSTNNASELPTEMLAEVLDLCHTIVCKCGVELLSSSIGSIVKYLAFMSADTRMPKIAEVKLKLILISDSVRDKVKDCNDGSERLDSVIISGVLKVLDNLETNAFLMLIKERQSQLATLSGFLKLLPEESLTLFLEIEDRRIQLINLLNSLSEFSSNQPFLLLTNSEVHEGALETFGSKIYSIEKRFKHLNGEEIRLVEDICSIIGSCTDWLSLNDIITNDLRNFSDPSNMFITYSILQGLLDRKPDPVFLGSVKRFIPSMLIYYIDSIQERLSEPHEEEAIIIVIAIESIVTLIETSSKFVSDKSLRTIFLKDLLCPMLRWASSSSRAISEAALSSLAQISKLYGYDSTKSLLESNIDYVVDGVMHMLENFSQNCDVTHVLAITFKLSSKNCFYYFRDVFERIFNVLAIYQHSEKAQLILLLFYRTLTTLIEWTQTKDDTSISDPLKNELIMKKILLDLSIDRRTHELRKKMELARRCQQALDEPMNEEDEAKVIEDIKCGRLPNYVKRDESRDDEKCEDEEKSKKKPSEFVLTERILTHCVSMVSSDYPEVKILALKSAALGVKILQADEDTLLPLVHKLWSPLERRLVGDYGQNLEVSLCAFECLVSMAESAKDFIKRRTLDSIIPRLCLFLESQAKESADKKDYGPYAMTVAYKCQLKILTHLGALAYHIELAYRSLWRVVRTTLLYLDSNQMESLRKAAKTSIHYIMALDADCVWYYSKRSNIQANLPFHLVFNQGEHGQR